MEQIRVVVHGAAGRMGQEVVRAVCQDAATQLAGAVDIKASQDFLEMPEGSGRVPFSADLGQILNAVKPDVMVDFTFASVAMPAIKLALAQGVRVVSGSTGWADGDMEKIDAAAREAGVGAVVAPNFALGAVLMMHLVKIAAPHLDYVEITELHHDKKLDAPSGTALSTARQMAAARGKPFDPPQGKGDQTSRGLIVEGVPVHSVRLPGLMAHQEVLFGAAGQTLSIKHDTINRECYMPGVLLAVKKVSEYTGLVHGLENILGL